MYSFLIFLLEYKYHFHQDLYLKHQLFCKKNASFHTPDGIYIFRMEKSVYPAASSLGLGGYDGAREANRGVQAVGSNLAGWAQIGPANLPVERTRSRLGPRSEGGRQQACHLGPCLRKRGRGDQRVQSRDERGRIVGVYGRQTPISRLRSAASRQQ